MKMLCRSSLFIVFLTGWIPKDSECAGGSTLAGLEGKKIKIAGTIDLDKGKPRAAASQWLR
jgi:hypothetical protein